MNGERLRETSNATALGNLEKFSPTAHLAHAIAAQIHRTTKAMARAKSPPALTKLFLV